MMNIDEQRFLQDFFGGWFRQDWDYKFDTYQEVTRECASVYDDSHVAKLVLLLRKLVAEYNTEETLIPFLVNELGCDCLPGPSIRGWVLELADILEASRTASIDS